MAALKDILSEQARIKDELQRMENDDDTTEEGDGNYRDTLIERWKDLDNQAKPVIERMEKIRAITRSAADEANLERPGGADGTSASRFGQPASGETPYRGGSPDLVVRTQRDPYEDIDAVADHMVRSADLRARAFDAIEAENKRGNLVHDFAENCTRMLENNGGRESRGISEHMLLTGSPEYQEAFRNFVEHPKTMRRDHEEVLSRTALALSATGSMLPFVLDPTIILTNTGSANPWRRISNVKQTTSNTWNGVTSAGVSAQWLTEGTIVVDSTPAVAALTITPLKAAAWVFGSYEVNQAA